MEGCREISEGRKSFDGNFMELDERGCPLVAGDKTDSCDLHYVNRNKNDVTFEEVTLTTYIKESDIRTVVIKLRHVVPVFMY